MPFTEEQLKDVPKYCTICGKRLVRKEAPVGVRYDPQTGKKLTIQSVSFACPDFSLMSYNEFDKPHDQYTYEVVG